MSSELDRKAHEMIQAALAEWQQIAHASLTDIAVEYLAAGGQRSGLQDFLKPAFDRWMAHRARLLTKVGEVVDQHNDQNNMRIALAHHFHPSVMH